MIVGAVCLAVILAVVLIALIRSLVILFVMMHVVRDSVNSRPAFSSPKRFRLVKASDAKTLPRPAEAIHEATLIEVQPA